MRNKFPFLLFLPLFVCSFIVSAQQQVNVISRCGGMQSVTIPSILDTDLDGLDDRLEQKLLDHFMPVIIQFDNETCPGPALDGSGDSNLLVCHIYPLPGQYTMSAGSPDSLKVHPVAMVSDTGLVTGMIWYEPQIIVQCALLYGKDCGTLGHTSDVEGFYFSLKYTGPDTVAGWMYDTILTNWMGITIQSVSHANTICEQIETFPYKSAQFPNGVDTVYASPNKHGNYLTISKCGSSFICNPACNGVPSRKNVRILNPGEANASMINDLGMYYPAYAGEDPWSTSAFLGGGAGTITHVTVRTLSPLFLHPQKLDTASQICDLYKRCYSCADSIYDYCIQSGAEVSPGTAGFSPWYHCGETYSGISSIEKEDEPRIFPMPANKLLQIIFPKGKGTFIATVFDMKGGMVKKVIMRAPSASLDISELPKGFYIIQLVSGSKVYNKKLAVE